MKSRDVLTVKTACLFAGTPVLSFVLAATGPFSVRSWFDPFFVWRAALFAAEGIVVPVAAVSLTTGRRRTVLYNRYPGRILRQESSFYAVRHD